MKEQLSNGDRNLAGRMSRFFLGIPCNLRYFLMNLKSMVVRDNYLKILILLTITGLILRLWHIGDVSFWLDETLTNGYSHQSFLEIWHIGMDGVNPPTFYWIEHVMLYFGSGEAVLRLVPALAGTCTIPVFYLLGREFHNRETGLVAAALLTVSMFHIYYSQEARAYTLLLFCFSLALLFYFCAIRTNSCSTWLLFGVFSALACWSHFFGFVMVFPLFLMAFVSRYRSLKTVVIDLKPVLLAGAVCFLLSLPMLLFTIHAGISKFAAVESWGVKGAKVITSTLVGELGPFDGVVIILLLLFLLGLVQLYRNNRHQFFFMVVAIALPFVITVALSYRMAITFRYLIGLLPFFFLGISYCISSVHRHIFTVRLSCIVILIIIALSVPSLNLYYSSDSKSGEDWKGLSLELHNLTGAGDTILVYPYFYKTPLAYYYHNETEYSFVYGIKNETDLAGLAIQNPDQKFFLIIVGSGSLTPPGEIGQWINSHAVLVEKHEELSLYRVK
jgi:uncharacterized membrane protein